MAGVAANFVLHVSDLMNSKEAQLQRQGAQTGMSSNNIAYLIGLDVGSTTVKAVVFDLRRDQIVWRDYQRHETRQPEKLLEFLCAMESEIGIAPGNCRVIHHRLGRQLAWRD